MTPAQALLPDAPALEWWRADSARTISPASADVAVDVAVEDQRPASGQAGYYALLAFTVVLIAAPQEFFEALKPLRLGLVAAVIAIAVYGISLASGQARAPVAGREVRLVLALVAWSVVMVPLSYWPTGSVNVMNELYLKSVAVFILLAGAIDSRRRLVGVVWTLGLCSLPIAVTALQHYQAGVYLPTAPGRIRGYGTSMLAGNPNDLALLLNLIIPFLIALAGRGGAVWRRGLAAGLALVAAAAVVVTFSRSGFITLATLALLYLWHAARRGRAGVAVGVFVVALGVLTLAPAGYGTRLSTVSDIDTDPTGSAQDRWRDMVVASGFVVEHPVIGAGLGMDFLALNERRGARWLSVHNVYLNYAVDLGVLGLALFIAIFIGSVRRTGAVERDRRAAGIDDVVTRIAGAARISLVAFAVAAFFYPVAYHAYFYYVAGLALAVSQVAAGEPRPAASNESGDAE
jgi:O-antigen ligase